MMFNDEPNFPANISQSLLGQTTRSILHDQHHQQSGSNGGGNEAGHNTSHQDDDECSNDSDPDRLEIEDQPMEEEEEEKEEEEEEEERSNEYSSRRTPERNGYDMRITKKMKLSHDERRSKIKDNCSPNVSPINRMDTPESNCSDSQVDQETTKLWQALARYLEPRVYNIL